MIETYGSNGQLRVLRINQGPVWGFFGGFAEANLRPQVLLRDSMNMNLSTSEPHFVFQISQPPNIGQKWFCISDLQINLSFWEKKTICKSVTLFTSYSNSCDTGEFMRFFKHPVGNIKV